MSLSVSFSPELSPGEIRELFGNKSPGTVLTPILVKAEASAMKLSDFKVSVKAIEIIANAFLRAPHRGTYFSRLSRAYQIFYLVVPRLQV